MSTQPSLMTAAFAQDLARLVTRSDTDGLDTRCPVCGRESCDDDHEAPAAVNGAPRFQPARTYLDGTRPTPLVPGLLWSDAVTVLAAESGAGKTFAALHLAAHVGAGLPWPGPGGPCPPPRSVAYISFEGDAFRLRLRALVEQGSTLAHVYLLRTTDLLSPTVDARSRLELPSLGETILIEALQALRADLVAREQPNLGLIILDTVRASLGGSEDSSENVSSYLRACRRLLSTCPGAALLLLHHTGWQDGETKRKRERGSSAFRGNVDVSYYLEADDPDNDGTARLTLTALKVRDGERPAPVRLLRRRVELPEYDHGEPVTSCIIEPDRLSPRDRLAAKTAADQAAQQQTDLAVLKVMRDFPEAKAHHDLRRHVGKRLDTVRDSVARILQARWATTTGQRSPYILTPEGHAVLHQESQHAESN